jgi:soluble lytic murein transglycosylase-like protein
MPRRRSVLHAGSAGVALALWPLLCLAGRQLEEPLSDAVRSALSTAVAGVPPEPWLPSERHRSDYARWLAQTSSRLSRYIAYPSERQEFLQTLWYEARRAGLSLSLVLGLVQVESAFRKFAVSSAGARGYMQVMPFWSRLIGDGNASRLFEMQTNLRFGCVILRHYLDSERGDLFMGLGRYNGTRGLASYPQAVLAAQVLWLHEVD